MFKYFLKNDEKTLKSPKSKVKKHSKVTKRG